MSTVPRALAIAVILTVPFVSIPAPAGEGGAQTADQHFRVGVYAFQQHSWDVAVREFEAAFEASPHYAVLYNLGLAYAEQGRPAEAVETLQKYLREGDTRIPAERGESVRKAIAENQRKLGELAIKVSPNGAIVSLDGRARSVDKPLALSAGKHTITVEAPERNPEKQTVEIRPEERQEIEIALQPKPAASRGTAAALRVSCRIPGVDVSIDGRSIGRFAGVLPVAPGTRRLVFSRAGYDPDPHDVPVEPDGVRDVACNLRIQKDLPERKKASFSFRPTLPRATISVDGSPYRNEPIPFGIHRVTVTCDDCVSWSRDVSLTRETRNVVADVDLLPSVRTRLEREHTQRRTWTWITGGTGVALGVTAGVLFAVNQQRANDWNDEGGRLSAALGAANPPDQALVAEALAHDQDAISIQRTGDIALGTAIVGGALLGIATYLYFTTEPVPKARGRATKAAFVPGFVW